MELVAKLIHGVEREMAGETVLHGHRSPSVQRKCHFRRIRKIERDAPPLDQSAVDVAPPDIEKSMIRCGMLKPIGDLDRLGPFDSLR
jgi:hypothetical protein